MFLALGVGAWSAAVFHFMTHAFFKALLFLAAGVVIEALDDEHDIFKMGGLRTRAARRLLDLPDRRRRPCRPAARDRRLLQQGPHHRPRACSSADGSVLAVARRPRRRAADRRCTPSGSSSSSSSASAAPSRRAGAALASAVRLPLIVLAVARRSSAAWSACPRWLGASAAARGLPATRCCRGARCADGGLRRRHLRTTFVTGRHRRWSASASPGCSDPAAPRRHAFAESPAIRPLAALLARRLGLRLALRRYVFVAPVPVVRAR